MPSPFTDATTPRDWQLAVGKLPNAFAKGTGIPQVFSEPGKMPCRSFGLPSRRSCPGYEYSMQKNEQGRWKFPKAICFLCYATGSEKFYTPAEEGMTGDEKLMQTYKQGIAFAHEYHLALSLAPTFVNDMILAIKRMRPSPTNDTRYFRLHWCGDIYSAEYCRKWSAICSALPQVRFWVPTRAWMHPDILEALQELNSLGNVNVRPSAIEFDDDPPRIQGLSAGSTGHLHDYAPGFVREGVKYRMTMGPGEAAMEQKAFLCPATTGEGKTCNSVRGTSGMRQGKWVRTAAPCRACWDRNVPVSYRQH